MVVASASQDGTARLWSLGSPAPTKTLKGHTALWWDECSKLPCMNGMAGLDSSCKYRVVHPTTATDHGTNPGGGTPPSTEDVLRYMLGSAGSDKRFGQMFNQLHSFCGARFDPRSLSMACHFSSKHGGSPALPAGTEPDGTHPI